MPNTNDKQLLLFSDVEENTYDESIKKTRNYLDELFKAVKQYRSSKHYMELLDFCTKFKSYSIFNNMLIYWQLPGAQYVLPAEEWRKKYNRIVKTDERPLIVLQPFGPVMFLYDISSTVPVDPNDDRIPIECLEPYKCVNLPVTPTVYNTLLKNLPYFGISLGEFQTGADYAGKLECSNDSDPMLIYEITSKNYKKSFKYHCQYTLKFSSTQHDNTIKFATIIHELGHLFLRHISCRYTDKWQHPRLQLSHAIKEFEAESVASMVCAHQGIDSQSHKYLVNYCDNNSEIPDVSVDEIFRAVTQIEKLLRPMNIKDGLLYQLDKNFKEIYNQATKKP